MGFAPAQDKHADSESSRGNRAIRRIEFLVLGHIHLSIRQEGGPDSLPRLRENQPLA